MTPALWACDVCMQSSLLYVSDSSEGAVSDKGLLPDNTCPIRDSSSLTSLYAYVHTYCSCGGGIPPVQYLILCAFLTP